MCPSVNLFSQISAPFPEEPEMTKSLVSSYLFIYLFAAFFTFQWVLEGKSLQMVIAAMKLKDAYSLERKLWPI